MPQTSGMLQERLSGEVAIPVHLFRNFVAKTVIVIKKKLSHV